MGLGAATRVVVHVRVSVGWGDRVTVAVGVAVGDALLKNECRQETQAAQQGL